MRLFPNHARAKQFTPCKNRAERAETFPRKQATTGKTWDRKAINSGESAQELFPNVQKLSVLCRNCVSGQKPMLKNQTSGVSSRLYAETPDRCCRASILAQIATRSTHSRNRHVFRVALRSIHSSLLLVLAVVGVPVVVLRWLLPRFRPPLLPLLSAAVSLLLSQHSPRTPGTRLRGDALSLGSSPCYTSTLFSELSEFDSDFFLISVVVFALLAWLSLCICEGF